jgi:hypothetical protein
MIHQINLKNCIDNEANNHKRKFNSLNFEKRQPCLSNNGYICNYESKNGVHSETYNYVKT